MIVPISERPRPKLVTPAKGSEGDLTNESLAEGTSVDSIIGRYAGNLAELKAWHAGRCQYGDQSAIPADFFEAFDKLKTAREQFADLGLPFDSFDDAYTAWQDGTLDARLAAPADNGQQVVDNPTTEAPTNDAQ